jgi:hypothetical protein
MTQIICKSNNSPLLTTFVLGAIIVSTFVVVMTALNDCVATLALGSRPKQWLAGVRAKRKLGSHALESVEECEGMNPHAPKGAPTLGVRVPVDSRIFKEQLQGYKPNGLRSSLYHEKSLGTCMSKMGSHDPFGHFKHKLWPKEGQKVKLPIRLPTTKTQESPRFPCVQVACDILLESSRQGLQIFFRPYLNRRSTCKVMGPQSCESPSCENFRTRT